MVFAPPQIRKLKAKLKSEHVRTRETEGATLHYLEGWHVVAEANRIFGFASWDRETVGTQCVWTKQLGSRFAAAYVTRVRIIVRTGDDRIVREGCGAGESNAATPGLAHEFAAKAAETDATKRALSTFGNAFGLSLYGGVESSVRHGRDPKGRFNGDDRRPVQSSEESAMPEIPVFTAAVPASIDKSALCVSEPKRLRNLVHLKFVARQPCLICGREPSHAHHLTFTQPHALGRKVSDEFTVPLCNLHHRELHEHGNERGWWLERNINPLPLASELWVRSHGWSAQEPSTQGSETATAVAPSHTTGDVP